MITLTGEQEYLLESFGLAWPDADEDAVTTYAERLGPFADAVGEIHKRATSTVEELSSTYRGPAFQRLLQRWQQATAFAQRYRNGCGDAGRGFAQAGSSVAETKGQVLAELTAYQAIAAQQAAAKQSQAPFADQATTTAYQAQIQQTLTTGEGRLGTAAGGAADTMDQAVQSGSTSAGGGTTSSTGDGYQVRTEDLSAAAAKLRGLAAALDTKAEGFAQASAQLSLGGGSQEWGAPLDTYRQRITKAVGTGADSLAQQYLDVAAGLEQTAGNYDDVDRKLAQTFN